MRWISLTGRSPIGLDIGTRAIKAVQLSRCKRRWEIGSAAALKRTGSSSALDVELARQVRMMLLRGGFVGDALVVAVPPHQLETEVLELPPKSAGAPLEQIARLEIARAAKLENEPFEMAFWELPASARASATTTVRAVAVREKAAQAILDPLEAEGFDVRALDTHSWAVARACASRQAAESMTALIDIGWSGALFTFVREQTVIYQRTLQNAGMGAVVSALAEELHLAEDEAELVLMRVGFSEEGTDEWGDATQCRKLSRVIARKFEEPIDELIAAINYASHRYPQQPVQSVLVMGGGSSIAGIKNHLSVRLNLDVKILTTTDLATCLPDMRDICSSGLLVTALGLATHEDED